MRDYKLYLDDILEAAKRIKRYSKGMTLERLKKDTLVLDGVVRNLEIIGDGTGESGWERSEDGSIFFNGIGEDSHEAFELPAPGWGWKWSFCNTAQKPYDEVVVACLAIFKHFLGDSFETSSDGNRDEWTDGVALACK